MEKQNRPKIHIPKTPLEFLFDGVALVILISSILYLISVWSSLPAEVPAHYNAAGEVDRLGSKWEMLILPIIASTMWISMTVLEKYPHVYNYPRLTKENIRAQYKNGRKMVHVLKNMITMMFAYITWKDIQVAFGYAEGLGPMFLPLLLLFLFIPKIYFVVKSYRL